MLGSGICSAAMNCQMSSSVQLLSGKARRCSPLRIRALSRSHGSGRWLRGSHRPCRSRNDRMRSLARALSSSRRPPPNAASKPCSAIASSSVTDCSRLRLARGPVSSTTRPSSIESCTLATTNRAPTRCDELVAVLDDLGEVVAGVDVHHRERQASRGERQHCEVQQHRRVLAAAEQQHRVLALGGNLADDRDRFVGQRSRCGLGRSRSYVQSALGLRVAGPPAAASILALGDRAGAWPAADRRVAALAERVGRQLVDLGVQRHVVVGPRRQRVDLDDVAADVVA